MRNVLIDEADDVQKISKHQSEGKKKQHKHTRDAYGKRTDKIPKQIIIAKRKYTTPSHEIVAIPKMEALKSAESEACL